MNASYCPRRRFRVLAPLSANSRHHIRARLPRAETAGSRGNRDIRGSNCLVQNCARAPCYYRFGASRVYSGDLRRARSVEAFGSGRLRAGRPVDDHHRRGELSRIRRSDTGPMADGADAGASRPCGRAHRERVCGGARARGSGRSSFAATAGARWPPRRSSWRPERKPNGLAWRAKRRSRASASRPARPATGSSSAASRSSSSGAAIPRSRRRCISPTSPPMSRSCIVATRSGRRKS